jgi:hypothetical protein
MVLVLLDCGAVGLPILSGGQRMRLWPTSPNAAASSFPLSRSAGACYLTGREERSRWIQIASFQQTR